MEGIGRGRARGRRVIEFTGMLGRGTMPVLTPACTKTFGRGFSAEAPEFRPIITMGRGQSTRERVMSDLSTPGRGMQIPLAENNNNAEENAKRRLVRELKAFQTKGSGCFIRITIDYFSSANDAEFYVEKVLNCTLKSYTLTMVEELAKCLKLISLHKIHGTQIKFQIFSKLQSIFQALPSSQELSNLPPEEKISVMNFCILIGQIYFRFRPLLDVPERWLVLAFPTVTCMIYLLEARGTLALSSLVNLITVNYKQLDRQAKAKLDELCLEAHKAIVTGAGTEEDRLWTLCVVDHLAIGNEGHQLSPTLSSFYTNRMGRLYQSIAVNSPTLLLADIPIDIIPAVMDTFDVDIATYNRYKFVEL